MKKKPTERQILGAKIRAEEERFVKKHRKRYRGGWSVPSSEERYEYLAAVFGMMPHEVSYFMTWCRECTHTWSDGACIRCPD